MRVTRATIEEMIDGTDWIYIGDENPLDYGGMLIKMDDSDIRHGYAEVIRIDGWDQFSEGDNKGCMVEVGSVFLERKLKEWRNIFDGCGQDKASLRKLPRDAFRRTAIDSCISYWGIDSEREYRTKRETGLYHLLQRNIS